MAAPPEGGNAHSPGSAAAVLQPVVAWADGIELIVSDKSDTGYECVVRGRGGLFVVSSKRFRNNKRDASGRPKPQTFETAQEAAVAYARLLAVARQQQQSEADADSDQEMSDARDGAEVRTVSDATAAWLVHNP